MNDTNDTTAPAAAESRFKLDDAGLDGMFRAARSYSAWRATPVSMDVLRELQHLAFLGPTAFNCEPLRVAFVISPEAKDKLASTVMALNVEKVRTAPVVAILATDENFYDHIDGKLYSVPVSGLFRGNPDARVDAATRNSNLQAGYFIMAARALGLDCGPMSGIDRTAIDHLFLKETTWRCNFICALGHGVPDQLKPRLPRHDFESACLVF